ncbi:hypothetical protein L7F22_016470 [Adiantum nelumboides]|nr:hypothetical protein [Adiantum nelumboides]
MVPATLWKFHLFSPQYDMQGKDVNCDVLLHGVGKSSAPRCKVDNSKCYGIGIFFMELVTTTQLANLRRLWPKISESTDVLAILVESKDEEEDNEDKDKDNNEEDDDEGEDDDNDDEDDEGDGFPRTGLSASGDPPQEPVLDDPPKFEGPEEILQPEHIIRHEDKVLRNGKRLVWPSTWLGSRASILYSLLFQVPSWPSPSFPSPSSSSSHRCQADSFEHCIHSRENNPLEAMERSLVDEDEISKEILVNEVLEAVLEDGSSSQRTSNRQPFTSLSQVDADLALARALQQQEHAYLLLHMGADGSEYDTTGSGSFDYDYGHDEEQERQQDEVPELPYVQPPEDDEDAEEAEEGAVDGSLYESDEAFARALQEAEHHDATVYMMSLVGVEESDGEVEDRSYGSQDAWQDVDPDDMSYEGCPLAPSPALHDPPPDSQGTDLDISNSSEDINSAYERHFPSLVEIAKKSVEEKSLKTPRRSSRLNPHN